MNRKTRRLRARTNRARLTVEALEDRIALAADWHNAAMPLDVSGDSQLTADDATQVLNALDDSDFSDRDTGRLFETRAANSGHLDVNNDGYITPLDAIYVINFLLNYDLEFDTYSFDASISWSATIDTTPNLDPVAVDDAVVSLQNDNTAWIRTSSLLANDVDADQDRLSIKYDSLESALGARVRLIFGTIIYDPLASSAVSTLKPGQTIRDEIRYEISDHRGGTDEGSLLIDVVGTGSLTAYRLEILDADGNATSSVASGDVFTLVAYAEDLREDSGESGGVFSAYFDVKYDGSAVTPLGEIVHGDTYPNSRSGSHEADGLLDEVGGFAGLSPVGSGKIEVFRQSFTAGEAAATIVFSSNESEGGQFHATTMYGLNDNIDPQRIEFGSVTLSIDG